MSTTTTTTTTSAVSPMMARFIGGESAGRSLFGGRRNKARNIGLTVVAMGEAPAVFGDA